MKFTTPKTWRCASVLLAGLALHALATAQDYPRKAITLVVPYAAGGATDVVARSLGESMSRSLGQPVIVDNKPGASGILGTNFVAKAAPDGYTVLIGLPQSMLTNQFLYDKLPYDPRKELALVTQLAVAPLVLLVPATSPVRSVAELQRELRANPKGANCGSWGAGAYPHLVCASMALNWKTEITHVAYKGEAPMLQDLAGGALAFTFGSVATARPLIDGGKLRAIAVVGEQRVPALPAVPTFTEAGFPDAEYRIAGWLAMAVPAGTPVAVIARLHEAAQQALGAPELVKRFEVLGMQAMSSTPEQFRASYAKDLPVWERLVKVSGAKLD